MRKIFITPLHDESLGLLSKFNSCLKKAVKENPNRRFKRRRTETGFVFDFDLNFKPCQRETFQIEKVISYFSDNFKIIVTH